MARVADNVPDSASPRELEAGRVGRPHGLDGSFHVSRPVAPLLAVGAVVEIADESRRVVRRAGTDARPILRLEGCDDRGAAEALRGLALKVAPREAPPLPAGEWWAHELEGCEVRSGNLVVGTVTRMLALPSCEVLEVDRAGRPILLVPMVSDAVRSVDVDARRIEVDLDFLGEDGEGSLASGRTGERSIRRRRRA